MSGWKKLYPECVSLCVYEHKYIYICNIFETYTMHIFTCLQSQTTPYFSLHNSLLNCGLELIGWWQSSHRMRGKSTLQQDSLAFLSYRIWLQQPCTFRPRTLWRFSSSSVHFSHSIMSDSLWPHGLQHARPPCPSPTPRACLNSCPLNRWCHPTISSSVVPFSSHLHLSQHQGLFKWVSS